MKTPIKPVTEESLQTGMSTLREFVETTEFAKKPEKKPLVNMAENQPRDEQGRWTDVGAGTQVDEVGLAKHRATIRKSHAVYNNTANAAEAMSQLCDVMLNQGRDSFARRDIANTLIVAGYDRDVARAAALIAIKKLEAMADNDEGVGYVSTVPLWHPERYANSDNRGFYVTDVASFKQQMSDWALDSRVDYSMAREQSDLQERAFYRDRPKANEFDPNEPRDESGKWTAAGAQATFDAMVSEHKLQSQADVLSVLQGATEHMSSQQLIVALSKRFPERWTTFYRVGKETARRVMAVLRELELDIQDNVERHRGRRGGMGKHTHFKSYKLKEGNKTT